MKHRNNHRKGTATVELAVLLPFMMYVCVIATDWARMLYFTITIQACARNGALYASDQVAIAKSPYADLTSATLAESPNLQATVASTTSTDGLGNSYVKVTVNMPFKTITNFPGVPSSQNISRSVQMRVVPVVTR